jgi:uncharacterized small protein (DUF1192 family)
MFDEEELPKKPAPVFVAAKLEALSVAQMQEYCADLSTEIGRVEKEIVKRGQHKNAAISLFKS